MISRPAQLDAMKPLAHARVTIIKLHGDYADLTQLNTVDELEKYDEAQQRFLERVLDDYGLIVCGWSADWDKALVRAVEGTRSRRYPMFWSTLGTLGTAAQQLVTQHGASVIRGMDADDLFTGLEKRLEALDRMSAPPVSRDMAVVQLKKALPDPVKRIDLFDLLHQHTMQVVDAVATHPVHGDTATFAKNVEGMRQDTDTLLHLLAAGVFHDDGTHQELWLKAVERLVRLRDTSPSGPYSRSLDNLRHYPALLATWTMGVAAVLARREGLIATLLTKPLWAAPGSNGVPEVPASYLNPWNVLDTGATHTICHPDNGSTWHYPQGRLLAEAVREPLRLVEPDDQLFQAANDRFQLLVSLLGMDTDGPEWSRAPWAGDFLADSRWGYNDNGPAGALQREIGPDWPLLRAGAFGGDPERAKAAFTALNTWRNANQRR
ncbi:hypothetical protein [Streptomyces sp. XY431]|uniref:hypothetical protein n=1 Tax=Streptomyces sp. XY431 TaxID=1415562 RepID=UPI0006AEE5F8|nr:hypothetical protein [Streptomyces sp. XY431]